jgi:hypothetical protein
MIEEANKEADKILVDMAPYVDPVLFRDCLLQCMLTTRSLVFGMTPSDVNHFSHV